MRNKNLKGTGVALVTPFNEDYTIDFSSLGRLIDYLIQRDINYFVVMGTTGEAVTLSLEEQNQVLQYVEKKVSGRIPIVLGVGGNNTRSILNQIMNLDLSKIAGILSVCPYYNRPSQSGIFNHFSEIAKVSPVDLILYNVPSRTASNINAETVVSLAHKHSNIIGIKEASGDINNCMDLVSKCPDDFMIISGDDKMTFPIMSLGGCGVISVQAMAFPNLFSTMVNACLEAEYDVAKKKHYELLKSVDLFYVDGNPSGIKEALFFKKICNSSQVRLPLVKMDVDNAKKMHLVL